MFLSRGVAIARALMTKWRSFAFALLVAHGHAIDWVPLVDGGALVDPPLGGDTVGAGSVKFPPEEPCDAAARRVAERNHTAVADE